MSNLDRFALGIIAGLILALFAPKIPDILCVFLCFCFLMPIFAYFRHWVLLGFIFGVAWMFAYSSYKLSWNAAPYLGQTIDVTAKIVSLDSGKTHRSYIVALEKIESAPLRFPKHAKIRLYADEKIPRLLSGGRYTLIIRIKPAHAKVNDGLFNYQTWLLKQGIRATGSIKQVTRSLSVASDRRQHWRDTMSSNSDRGFAQAVLLALSLADRQDLSSDNWQVLRQTGTTHLIAISGLHIGLAAVFFYSGFRVFGKIRGLTFLAKPLSKVVAFCLGGLFYAWLADFGVTTLRALLFMVFVLIAFYFQRRWPVSRLLLYCFCVLVILNPFLLLDAGLWLSFIAVSGIFALHHRFDLTTGSYLKKLLLIQFGLAFIMFPISSFLFSGVTLHALWVNIVAIPVVSVIVVPLCLLMMMCFGLGAEQVGIVMVALNEALLEYLLIGLNWAGRLEAGWLNIHVESLWQVVLVTALCFFILLPVNNKVRSALLLMGGFVVSGIWQNSTKFRIDVLDVGQGLSVLISTNDKTLLYDTGEKYRNGSSAAERIIYPYIQQKGLQISDIVISHDDNDHAGGSGFLLQRIRGVQRILTNIPHGRPKMETTCLAGLKPTTEFRYTVLWPLTPEYEDNDDSCVIRIEFAEYSVLLTGDISRQVEARLVAMYGESLQSDLLIVPHHGSKSSSSYLFINAVAPKLAIASAGYQSRFGHPHKDVVQRYIDKDIEFLNTGEVGQVSIIGFNTEIRVLTYRQDMHPYWFINR